MTELVALLVHVRQHQAGKDRHDHLVFHLEQNRKMKYFILKYVLHSQSRVVTPAILCHKESARGSKDTTVLFACSSLVLYGIRLVGFHADGDGPHYLELLRDVQHLPRLGSLHQVDRLPQVEEHLGLGSVDAVEVTNHGVVTEEILGVKYILNFQY